MSRSMRLLIVSVVVLLAVGAGLAGAAIAGSGTTPAVSSSGGRQEGITVQGQGQSEGTPDVMRLSLSVDVTKSTIQNALDASNSAVAKVMSALRKSGVAQKDIQTTGLSIDRAYTYPKGAPPRLRGYHVGNSVQAKIRDLKNAGKTISACWNTTDPGEVFARRSGSSALSSSEPATAARKAARNKVSTVLPASSCQRRSES